MDYLFIFLYLYIYNHIYIYIYQALCGREYCFLDFKAAVKHLTKISSNRKEMLLPDNFILTLLYGNNCHSNRQVISDRILRKTLTVDF